LKSRYKSTGLIPGQTAREAGELTARMNVPTLVMSGGAATVRVPPLYVEADDVPNS
jgi:hypothetical protein